MQNAFRLQGIVPPLVTPLADRDRLDTDGLSRLVGRMLAGGVHGVFILGTTGEAPSLSYRLRRELIDIVCELVAGAVPIYVGITDTSFVESVGLTRHAQQAGASAVVLSTPYYFPAGQTELTQYVRNLVPELPLPTVLYNMPSLTKVSFEVETLAQLADLESIVGIKDSSGDMQYFAEIVKLRSLRPEWSFMVGTEALLAEAMALGADGGVSGGANVFPKLFVACYQALRDQEHDLASALNQLIGDFQAVYDIGKYASRHIKATKCCLSLLHVCDDFMAEPFNRFQAPERLRVWKILAPILERLDERALS